VRLYTDTHGSAPSPRRVLLFLAEKGLEIPLVYVDIDSRETRTPEFREKNAMGNVPVLELDDGTCLAESMAICRYLEELHPEPNLFGATPLERAQVSVWTRRAEGRLYMAIDLASAFKDVPQAEQLCRAFAGETMKQFDEELAKHPFVAGERFTMADIVCVGALDYGIAHVGFRISEELVDLQRWYAEMQQRASVKAC
jgi:glutathione S-transferase